MAGCSVSNTRALQNYYANAARCLSAFLFEQGFQLGSSTVGRRTLCLTRMARGEIFAEVGSIPVDHTLSLWFATLIIEGGIVKIAIKANVKRTVALGAHLPKTDPLPKLNLPSAMKTVHQFTPTKSYFCPQSLHSSGLLPRCAV